MKLRCLFAVVAAFLLGSVAVASAQVPGNTPPTPPAPATVPNVDRALAEKNFAMKALLDAKAELERTEAALKNARAAKDKADEDAKKAVETKSKADATTPKPSEDLLKFLTEAEATAKSRQTAAVAELTAAEANQKKAVANEEAARTKLQSAEKELATAISHHPLALGNAAIYEKSLAALTMAFVIALLLESAFAIIFKSRLYLTYISLGMKAPIMFVVSWFVVVGFGADIFSDLIAAYKSTPYEEVVPTSNALSKLISALVLAGGSAGVYNIMRAMGFRNDNQEEAITSRPPENRAWLALIAPKKIKLNDGVKMLLTVDVHITEGDPAPTGTPRLAGNITFKMPKVVGFFLRRNDRFPPFSGHELKANVVYKITVTGVAEGGTDVKAVLPAEMVFAPKAIVDMELTKWV